MFKQKGGSTKWYRRTVFALKYLIRRSKHLLEFVVYELNLRSNNNLNIVL